MSGATDYSNPNALVEADWLEVHLDDPALRVVEVDVSPKSYAEGHLPGAVFWDIYKTLKDATYRLVDQETLAKIFSASGIGPDTKVVFYGYGPALGYWLLKHYRHADAAILNMSKQRWREEGRPWTSEVAQPAPVRYDLPSPDDALRASQPAVEAAIGAAGCALLDVRAGVEFRGERFWPSGATEGAGRAGHVPGAINVPPDGLLRADGSFAPVDALRRVFPAKIDDVRELVTYCTIGNRASLAWFVLTELLGRPNVRVYDGSWAEWGLLPGTPLER